MPKLTYSKLKLTVNKSVKELNWNDQTIEIKEYLSIEDRLKLITDVLNAAADENRFYTQGKVDLFFVIKVIEYYTNISFTDKQQENFIKLYDELVSSGLYHAIINQIPDEINSLYDSTVISVKQIEGYQNSVYGILDATKTDYNNLDLDIDKMQKALTSGEGVEYLNNVLTKLG